MKTTLSTVIIAFVIFTATPVNAQQWVINNVVSNTAVSKNIRKVLLAATENNTVSKAALRLAKGQSRALKRFAHAFKDVEDVKWSVEKETITASFKKDNKSNLVVYAPNGDWLRNMKVYSEKEMPKAVRALIKKSDYFDYKITFVQDFKEGYNQFYIVHLEDERHFKQVSVYNNELNLVKEYKRQVQ